MPQRLVSAERIGVMVRVPLQVEEYETCDDGVAVPAVRGRHPFVAAFGRLPPPQPVVLQIVDGLEQANADDRLPEQPRHDHGAEPDRQHHVQHGAEQPRLQDVVLVRPAGPVDPGQALRFEVPGGSQTARHRSRDETVKALPHAGTGGVFRGRDPDVVSAVVLDVELAVAGLCEGNLAEAFLQLGPLVSQVVRGVDGGATKDPCGHHQSHPVGEMHGEPAPARPQPAGEREGEVLDGQKQIGGPAVEGIILQPLEGAIGRVVRVGADKVVEQRHEAERHDRASPPPHPSRADVAHAQPGQPRQARGGYADQPEHLLGVSPARRRRACRAGLIVC